MSVTSTVAYTMALGNGAATAFPFGFAARSAKEVAVYVNGALTLAGYTVKLNPGDANGGTVTFTTAPANGTAIRICSNPSFAQNVTFVNSGPYSAAAINAALDEADIRSIFLYDIAQRSLRAPQGETVGDMPSKSSRANLFLKFDGNGNPVVSDATGPAGPPGSPGDGYATRAAMAAATASNGFDASLNEPGREGKFVFSNANLSTEVSADTAQGIYVAPAWDPTGASGAWVRKPDGPWNVRWFGAVGDFLTDDLPAFNAALSLLRAIDFSGSQPGGGRLVVPGGKYRYYLSNTLNIHTSVVLVGDGSAQNNSSLSHGTLIRFGKNCNGIVLNEYRTDGDGLGSQGDAGGSIIEGFMLWGGNVNVDASGNVTSYAAGDSTSGHGIRIRAAFCEVRDVQCSFFGGDGFNINATSGSSDPTQQGTADSWRLTRCQAIYNRQYGFHCNGNDSNAGVADHCSAITNGGAGIVDYSFLGNTWIHPHTRDNGHADPVSSNGPVGTCTYGGNSYYAKPDKLTQASTTVPGTDSTVWVQFGGLASVSWVTGMTWVAPGAYVTNPSNANGTITFVSPYAESGQAPVQAGPNTLFIGGLLLASIGFDTVYAGCHLTTKMKSLEAQTFHAYDANAAATVETYLSEVDTPHTALYHYDGTLAWRWCSDGNGAYGLTINDTNPLGAAAISLRAALTDGRRPSMFRYGAHATDGDSSNYRFFYGMAAVPAANAWNVGDTGWVANPVSGGAFAWRCVTAGSPGTWENLYAMNAPKQAAWAAWTGTASRATADTSTATVAQCAQAIMALIADLQARGVLG